MRGKRFYDVMPLERLCQYQLQQLQECLKANFQATVDDMTLTIDDRVACVPEGSVHHKIPGDTFGRITILVNPQNGARGTCANSRSQRQIIA